MAKPLRRSKRKIERRRSAGGVAAALLSGLLLTGCGATTAAREGADTEQGRELFTQKCGACHVLADAGTAGETGPNLDDAFGYPRKQGFRESTFFEITLEQMEIPAPPMPDFDDPDEKENYLSEEDRTSIAAYVASVAGKPRREAAGEATDPKSIFTASCGSCHTLEDAGTTGAVGPNLDDTKPGLEESVRQIANGGGGMPAFKDQLSEEQIRRLAEYIAEATGGG